MNLKTRLSYVLETVRLQLLNGFKVRKTPFTIALFCLFSGFLFGNLFGTFVNKIREFVPWDGLIIVALILLIEFTSYYRYFQRKNYSILSRIFNYFKIGLMLGFFIDAFKVGS